MSLLIVVTLDAFKQPCDIYGMGGEKHDIKRLIKQAKAEGNEVALFEEVDVNSYMGESK